MTNLEPLFLWLDVTGSKAEELKRMAGLDEFRSQLEETVQGWTEQWFAQGVEKGIEQGVEKGVEKGIERGRAEGVAAQRTLLRSLAAHRFGASARHLDPLFDEVHSTAKLAEIGEWLMLDTMDQLIAKIEAVVEDDRIH